MMLLLLLLLLRGAADTCGFGCTDLDMRLGGSGRTANKGCNLEKGRKRVGRKSPFFLSAIVYRRFFMCVLWFRLPARGNSRGLTPIVLDEVAFEP